MPKIEELSKLYVLGRRKDNRSGMIYWTGKTHYRKPQGTTEEEKALHFYTAREAYEAAGQYPLLLTWRAFRVSYEKFILDDGFIPRWWDPMQTFEEYRLFGNHYVTISPSKENKYVSHLGTVEGLDV